MTQAKKKKIAVLMGGWSAGREVSLLTGSAVCKALGELGHEVLAIDVQRDPQGLLQALTKQASGKPDVIFNALHGRFGEDGMIQGYLDFIGIPYTHSGVLASAIAMDKPVMKALASQNGVPCPEGFVVKRRDIVAKGYPMQPPFVIKPTNEGSSVGVRLVKDSQSLHEIEEDSWIYGESVLLEKYIPGRELTVSVLGHTTEAKALAVTELRPKGRDFYDYTAKSEASGTEQLTPAPIPQDVYDEACRLTLVAYRAAGCHGAARADLRWDDSKAGTSGLVLLELNTQPPLAQHSVLPQQAAYNGMSFNDLITWMIEHPTCPAS